MKRLAQIFMLMMLASLFAACGTDAAPTATSGSGSNATAAPTTGGSAATAPAATTATKAPEATTASGGGDEKFVVGVVQQTTHPALDAARMGIADAFKQSGLDVELVEKNAQNDQATLTSIIDGFRDDEVDLVIAIGTLPAQTAFNGLQGSDIPIVFNTVTDPYAAKIATSATEHPGVTGVQALPPVTMAFDLITEINPDTKRVGIIWTSTERNSEVVTGIAREYAGSQGIEFIEQTVTKADEVLGASEALANRGVEAIFISTDSTVVSALESVVKVANENGVLLVCNDPASAKRGCAAALGLDYYDNGYISATDFAIPILKGEATADELDIKIQEKVNIAINTDAAEQQGVEIPEDLMGRADKDKVYDKIEPKAP